MKQIEFVVPMKPISQPRQRHVALAKGISRNYVPQKHPVHAFKAGVVRAAKEAYDGPPLKGPLHLRIEFVFPRPKSKIWKTKPMPRFFHISTPDVDNCIKSVADALNKITWRDDSQICSIVAAKYVASGGEPPCVKISIEQREG